MSMELAEATETMIRKLIDDQWNKSKIGFKPIVSTGWFDAEKPKEPQVTVSPGPTTPHYFILDSKQRELTELLEINVWTSDEAKRFKMVQEVDRIVQIYRNSPGSSLSRMWTSNWTPLDEPDKGPLYRSRILISLVYYKTSVS